MLKRKVLGLMLTVALLLSFMAFAAEAAGRVDPGEEGTLTLTYSYDGQGFAGLEIRIYQVASVSEYADFTLTGAFAELPVEVNRVKTREEWKQVASTLSAYATAETVAPDREMTTGEDGGVSFARLPLGLYLVEGVQAELENGYCRFDSFVISVPDLNAQDAWEYAVVAKPKSVFQEIQPEEITYTVNKLWKDEGHTHLRPKSITLALYRNGAAVENVILSAENNWTYSWNAEDDGSVWQVVERHVPEGYTVTMEQREAFFLVTNSYDEPANPPDTGDLSYIHLYLLGMLAAGVGLIALGVIGRKERKV